MINNTRYEVGIGSALEGTTFLAGVCLVPETYVLGRRLLHAEFI